MKSLDPVKMDKLQRATSEFIGAFEVMFRYDWQYTTEMIGGEEPTFLEPGINDESEDWGTRGALLEKYRNLVAIMKECGMAPIFPFSLENLPGSPKPIW